MDQASIDLVGESSQLTYRRKRKRRRRCKRHPQGGPHSPTCRGDKTESTPNVLALVMFFSSYVYIPEFETIVIWPLFLFISFCPYKHSLSWLIIWYLLAYICLCMYCREWFDFYNSTLIMQYMWDGTRLLWEFYSIF